MSNGYLLLSLILHVLLIASLFTPNPPKSIDNKIIIEVPVDAVVHIKNTDKNEYSLSVPKKEANVFCKSFYIGVGIIVYFVELNGVYYERVYAVKKGYGAWKAGLLVDDIILHTSESFKGGVPGTVVKAKILRGEREIFLEVVKDKICTED